FCKDKDMRRLVLRLLRDWRRQVYPTFLSNPYNYRWNFLKENGFFNEEELQRLGNQYLRILVRTKEYYVKDKSSQKKVKNEKQRWEEENQFEDEYVFEENAEEQRSQDQKDSEVKASELSTHHKGDVDLSKVTQLLVLSENQDDDSDKGGNELTRKLSKKEQQQWQPRSSVKMQSEPLVKKGSLKKKKSGEMTLASTKNAQAKVQPGTATGPNGMKTDTDLDANRIEKKSNSINWNIQLNCANLIISCLTAF
ncbi:hypothetical protein RFI_29679, partial [Reticulomyxa filosa]